jgi:hypothetical protein
MEMVIQRMSDFEFLLLFLSLLLFVTSIVFMARWIGGRTNDVIGLFSVASLTVSLSVPYVVVPDALNHAVKVLFSPFTKLAKDVTSEIVADTTAHARQTAREVREEARQGSWVMRQLLGGKKAKKTT